MQSVFKTKTSFGTIGSTFRLGQNRISQFIDCSKCSMPISQPSSLKARCIVFTSSCNAQVFSPKPENNRAQIHVVVFEKTTNSHALQIHKMTSPSEG